VRPLTELASPPPIIAPQYGKLIPFQAAAPAATPVIPTRYGQPTPIETPALVPSQYGKFPYFQAAAPTANPVIQTRYGQPTPVETPAVVPPQYGKFPYPSAAVAAANPAIAFRIGQGIQPAPAAYNTPQFQGFTVQLTYPVIPIRTRSLSELAEPTRLVPPQYHRLVTFPSAAAPANPVPGYRYGQGLLAEVQAFVQPQVGKVVPFSSAVAPANPVIALRVGQTVPIEPPAIIPSQVGRVIPVAAPANPVIPIRARRLEELTSETRLVLPSVFPFPYFQQPAPANAVIAFRMRPLTELTIEPRPIPSTFFTVGAFFQPAPANPVIPFRRGQWLGDAVVPLVGIKGYGPFPWQSVAAPSSSLIAYRVRVLSELSAPTKLVAAQYFRLMLIGVTVQPGGSLEGCAVVSSSAGEGCGVLTGIARETSRAASHLYSVSDAGVLSIAYDDLPDEVVYLQSPNGQWWVVVANGETGIQTVSTIDTPGDEVGLTLTSPGLIQWVWSIDNNGILSLTSI
jgi:hypothetical protein